MAPGQDYTDGRSAGTDATGLLGDRAGFGKPIAWWLRAHWLSNVSLQDAGRPCLWPEAAAGDQLTVRLVESWVAPPLSQSNRSVHVYTNAPRVRLWLNGAPVGEAAAPGGIATFTLPFAPGNLTAEALDAKGASLGSHTALTPDARGAARLALTLDAPSPSTGTGSALVADGQDVAMVRAELLDAQGSPISPQHASAAANVTFSVVSGGGRLLGTHNGSPDAFPDVLNATVAAHYGLARAYVQSTEVRAFSAAVRRTLAAIHVEAGRGGTAAILDGGEGAGMATPPPIVVQAEVAGLPTARLNIPLTTDLAALPLAVASGSAFAA